MALVYLMNRRHTYYELARSLHQDLTSGPVAEARATLAPLRYGNPQQRRQVDPHQALDAYFIILWCFERIQAGRTDMTRGTRLAGGRAARRFLDDMIRWHVQEWQTGLQQIHLPTRKPPWRPRLRPGLQAGPQ